MKIKNWFWGLFFILGGAAIVINQLGYFEHINIVSLVFTIFLIPIIIKSIINAFWGGIFFPLALLGIIYAEPLGIANMVPWPILLTALLLTIGFEIMFHRNFKFHSKFIHTHHNENFDKVINEEDDSNVSVNVNFGSSIKYVNSKEFKIGIFTCHFGAMKVYFDNTTLHEGKAIIDLDVSFSGVELYIPKNWTVEINASTSLGGIDEKNRNMSDGKHTLIINGKVSLSGIEIIYV